MFNRNRAAKLLAEFLGTGLLTLVIVSVQRSTIGVPYFVGIAGGLAAATLILVLGRASGAQLNPAVTIALWTARQVRSLEALLYVAAQLLGGLAAGALYKYLIHNDLTAVSHTFTGRVLVAEAVGALLLGLGWAAATYNLYGETKKAVVVGGSYVLGIIAASAASVGIVNPAVALGANAWSWGTYVLGPVLGAVIGVNLYGLLFTPTAGRAVAAAGVNAKSNAAAPAVATATESNRAIEQAPAKKSEKAPKKEKAPAKKKTTSSRKK
jgi:glycerol uptake facilitator-like aquaporin